MQPGAGRLPRDQERPEKPKPDAMRKLKEEHRGKSGLEIARLCARVALDNKAEDLALLDVRGLTSFTDFFVIMSGRSTRHVQGLAEKIENELRSKRVTSRNSEGLREGVWILLDYDDVVVHIFYSDTRKFYDLDGLWHDAARIPVESAPGEPAA
jgi:ribosome-associated protein